MKELYKFNIYIDKEVEKSETKPSDDGNGTIIITKKVIEKSPIEFFVKEPNRNEKEEAEIVRATYLANFIRRGVMPEAVLSKIYSDLGGVENELDKKLYSELTTKFTKKIEEYQTLMVNNKDDKEKIDLCLKDIVDIKKELAIFQYQQNSFFENTAEYKAKMKLIEYLFVFLTYYKSDEKSEIKQYFDGDSFEKKMLNLEKLENEENEIYKKIKDIILFVISAYIHTGGFIKKDEMEKLIKENFNAIQ